MPLSPFGRSSVTALPTSKPLALALLILLLAAFLRLGGLARDQRLHPDEALYGDLARRVGVWGDWQLQNTLVDKPPLFFFVGGFFYRTLGVSEFSTRLPNALASLINLALLFALARRLGGSHQTAILALLLAALSPLDVALAVSGFLDVQMMTWALLGLVLLTRKRWGWAGLALGLALATKPSALWLLPPAFLMGVALYPARWRAVLCGVLALGGVLLLVTLWDHLGSIGDLWQLGRQNSTPNRLIRSDEVWRRAARWLDVARYLLPHGVLALAIPMTLFHTFKHPTRRHLTWWVWAGFVVVYGGVHWLAAFDTFDRYLYLLLPPLFILVAANQFAVKHYKLLMLVVLVLGVPNAHRAAQGRLPIANDADKHTGIDQLATTMQRDFSGEVFYEHWLGWELRYYLGAEPQVWLLYFDTADELADYAQQELPTIPVPRYFVAPKVEAPPWVRILAERGIGAVLVYDDGRYVIYSLAMSS